MIDAKKQSLGIVIGLVIVAAVTAAKWLMGNMFVRLVRDIFS